MYKVSIIIPIFNAEKHLKNVINSVLNQTYKNIELILVNDGSTDGSLAICDSFLYDKRVKVITQENSGVSVARNKGIENAIGDWIMFVDSDDYIECNIISSMIESMENSNVKLDFVFCGFKKNYLNSEYQNQESNSYSYFCENRIMNKSEFCINIDSFIKKCLLQGPWGKIFSRKIIEKYSIRFHKELSYGEDTLFVYNYLKNSSNIMCLKNTFYHYNVFDNNSLNMKFRKDKLKLHIMLNKALEDLIKNYNIKYNEILALMLITSYVSYCGELCKSNLSKREKYICLSEINSYTEVVYTFKKAKKSFQNIIIKMCISHHMYKFEMLYFNIKEKIRKNQRLFNFLLGRRKEYETK